MVRIMKVCYITIFWLLFSCATTYADNKTALYKLGIEKSADQLVALADSALFKKNRPDSALIYSLILATKFQHKKHLRLKRRITLP